MFAGTAHDFRRGIKTHGLGIEQCRGKGGGMMLLDPGGDVNQQRKTGGMTFGETVTAEALYLFKATLREGQIVTALDHAADEFLLESVHGADMAERRHGAAQTIGFI